MTDPLAGRRPHPVPWVALVYHDVLPDVRATGGGPERFSVPARMFDLMLDTIVEAGFLGCSLATALEARGRPRVALTFDDGTAGVFHHAAPALRRRGMTATVYVVSQWVGRPGFMSWDELRQLVDWGMSVQSHTASHPFLSELGEQRLRSELLESKAAIDRELGQETAEIAFPGGDAPGRRLRHVLDDCGYRVAVGTRWGRNPDQAIRGRILRRCTVRGDITPDWARRVVRGNRWLAFATHPREIALRALRSAIRPSRYATIRRRLLDGLEGSSEPAARAPVKTDGL